MKVVWLNTRLEVFNYEAAAAASVDWMLSHMLLPHHLVGISHDKAQEFYTAAFLLSSLCNKRTIRQVDPSTDSFLQSGTQQKPKLSPVLPIVIGYHIFSNENELEQRCV